MAPYLAAYFQDMAADNTTEDRRLYLATSADGLTFNPIGRARTNGVVGDPSVLPPSVAPDGRWHVACTNHDYSATPPQNTVDVYSGGALDALNPVPQTVSCAAMKDSGTVQWSWGPEWFKDSDGTVYLLVAATTNANAGLFEFYTWALPATNAALTTWGTPVKVGTGFYQGIDANVVKVGSTYYCFIKQGDIRMYSASAFPAGPWTLVHTGLGGGAVAGEACNIMSRGGSSWRLYYDQWDEDGKIKYTDSSDGLATFGASSYVTSPDRMRHASIIDLAGEPPLNMVAAGGQRSQVAA